MSEFVGLWCYKKQHNLCFPARQKYFDNYHLNHEHELHPWTFNSKAYNTQSIDCHHGVFTLVWFCLSWKADQGPPAHWFAHHRSVLNEVAFAAGCFSCLFSEGDAGEEHFLAYSDSEYKM